MFSRFSSALALGFLLAAVSRSAFAQSVADESDTAPIIVTAPGGSLDQGESEPVDAAGIRGVGHVDLFSALTRNIPGLSLQEAQDNPYQPNLTYRGFTASPLQGQPQGLAVYLDGARFNQPFGDTVQFDLLPEPAIERVDIFDASAVYGLNALGGAIVIQTKTGRDAPGLSLSADAGEFGQSQLIGEAGLSKGPISAYAALERDHDDGWRRFSPSDALRGIADFGWDGDRAGFHLKLLGANTDLTGNGTAPIELLRADYRSVFTAPDITRHGYVRASLHPWLQLGDRTRLEATLYWQRLRQRTINGDAADIETCDESIEVLCLEDADGAESALIDQSGAQIPASAASEPYGLLNLSSSTTEARGVLTQLVDKRKLGNRSNTFVAGFSFDGSNTAFASRTELGTLSEERAVVGAGPIIAQPDGSIAPVSLNARTRYLGLFVSDRVNVTPNLSGEIDLRWNEASVDLNDHIGTALDGSHDFRRVNPGVQFDWRIASNAKLRAGYSESNRAPAPAELACADPQAPCSLTNFFVGDPPLKQVISHSFELGGEGNLGEVKWLLSAYRSTNSDDIQDVASDVRGRAFFQNVGSTRRQGLEATIAYKRGSLSLRAGYALTNATFSNALLLNSPDNPLADANGQIQVLPGNRLPGIPRHRGLLTIDYDEKGWSFGGDIQATSNQRYFGDEANLVDTISGYVVANLRGSIRVGGPFHLFAEVRNIFDKHYATFGTFTETEQVFLKEAPDASDPRSLSPAAPRRWLVGFRAEI